MRCEKDTLPTAQVGKVSAQMCEMINLRHGQREQHAHKVYEKCIYLSCPYAISSPRFFHQNGTCNVSAADCTQASSALSDIEEFVSILAHQAREENFG